jgi:hypothetical protein
MQSLPVIVFRILISLFVVFCAVRAVHKFLVNEGPNRRRPVERRSFSNRNSCFWQDIYVFLRQLSRMLRDSTHAVQVDCILWSEGQYRTMCQLCCIVSMRGLSKRSFVTRSEHGLRRYSMCQLGFNYASEDLTSTKPLRRRSLTAQYRVRCHASPCGIYGIRSGSETDFSLSDSVFPCQFHSSSAQYPLVYHWHYITAAIPTCNLKYALSETPKPELKN